MNLQHVQRSQVIICVLLHALYLLNGGALVFQRFTDRLCDFIAGFCDGGLHFRHLVLQLTVVNLCPQRLCQMRFSYLFPEKFQIARSIIARPSTGFHKSRFTHQVDAAHIKPEILSGLNVRTGDTPLTAGPQITGRGFHLCGVCNFCLRKPELKLHRRVINGQFRDCRYLKIPRRQFNTGRRCRCVNPERGGGGFALLAIAVNRPDRQGVFPERQATETVLRIGSDGGGQQAAVLTASAGQAQTEAHTLHHPRRVPFRLCQILTVSRAHLHRQVLHSRRDDAVQRTGQWLKAGPVIHNGFFFRYVLHRRDGKGAVRVFPDGDTAEQATTQ
ncbi:hypothetical protein BvCmsOUP037_00077 [Escherichia coli]|nr:hypothetical protein BvCmsOUP037_00077 [Escherichia coli]